MLAAPAAVQRKRRAAVWRPAREGRAPAQQVWAKVRRAQQNAGVVCRVRCMLGSNGPKRGAWVGCSALEAGRGSGGHGHAHTLAQVGRRGSVAAAQGRGSSRKTTCESRLGRGSPAAAELTPPGGTAAAPQPAGGAPGGKQWGAAVSRQHNQRGTRNWQCIHPAIHPSLQSAPHSSPCPVPQRTCTALSAAPFLIWSPHTKRSRPLASSRLMSRRTLQPQRQWRATCL
jgi:hypothetical protein